MERNLVFVYGTLRRGFGNSRYLLDKKTRDLGTHRTVPGFSLYLVTGGIIPGMIEDSSTNQVTGELYEVSGKVLKRLDSLEGVPHLYHRNRISLVGNIRCWAYIWPRGTGSYIPSGDYTRLFIRTSKWTGENRNEESMASNRN